MKVQYGNGKTKYGPGIDICLTGSEVAEAINLWLAKTGNVIVTGPSTITVNGHQCKYGLVYVDPSGSVKTETQTLHGRGPTKEPETLKVKVMVDEDTTFSGKPVTRKYAEEYKLYYAYTASSTTHQPKSYTDWLTLWEDETQARQQAILNQYALALGYSVNPILSLQGNGDGNALCFELYVSPKG